MIKSVTERIQEKEYLYRISHTCGLGAASIHRLREFFGSYEAAWKSRESELRNTNVLTPKRLEAFLECRKREDQLKKGYEELEKKKIHYVTTLNPEFPERLRPYKDCPAGLFYKGMLPKEDTPTVAIVGARNCTEYGKGAAEYLALELAKYGIGIISGLALGVDSAAHRGCLRGNGKTYAVMGCGVNLCYPRENYRLFNEIEATGGIISEFVPGTEPASMNFPLRNRIISGLSDAVIIVEAREKSGSLITGDLALEQGKEVFAVPGRINDPLSAGCNRLLQIGAAICLGPENVLEYFGIQYGKTQEQKLRENKKSEKRLAKKENIVYSFLDSRPKSLEEIVTFCQISVSEALEILMSLELYGLVQNGGNQYYCRKM